MDQKLIFTNTPAAELDAMIAELGNPRVFVLADANTAQLVLPKLSGASSILAQARQIVIPAGDDNKNIDSLRTVWDALGQGGATRSSLLVNVGGGMVTDLGGFAASTFKRGMRFINVPTTLLGAVDASVGGKTGINYNGLKNEIGVFATPLASIISTIYFDTLSTSELLSGYAEMLKHALLEGKESLVALLGLDLAVCPADRLLELLEKSVNVKKHIVDIDFREQGLRKALNLGHTAGHAFESLAMRRHKSIPHGYAVAHGCVVALVLSRTRLGFPSDTLLSFATYIRENYSPFVFTCEDYPELIELMGHDKKNIDPHSFNFTLLSSVGEPQTDCTVSPDDVRNALDIYRDLIGF